MKLHNPFAIKETVGLVVSLFVVCIFALSAAVIAIELFEYITGISKWLVVFAGCVIAAGCRVGYAVVKGK